MEMKRVTLGVSILALSTAFIIGCEPNKNVAPEADTEVQSSLYASYANYIASDIDMICSYLGENIQFTHPYAPYSPSSGTITPTRDTNNILLPINGVNVAHDQMVLSWNLTRCKDGRLRDGSILMYIPQIENQRYARNHKFAGQIRFANYKVDGWLIELADPNAPVYLYNTVPTATFNPANTKLTWKFAGKLKFTHPTDPNKNMIWEGELLKTLDNTSDKKVYTPPTSQGLQTAINWSLAVLKFDGFMKGSGPQIDADGKVTPNVPYSMTINKVTPLVRDFLCSSDVVTGVVIAPTGTPQVRGDEHHPFKQGVASFTVGNNYPRQIYYGNEGDPSSFPQCDNTGEVLIKGTSYRVDFFK